MGVESHADNRSRLRPLPQVSQYEVHASAPQHNQVLDPKRYGLEVNVVGLHNCLMVNPRKVPC